MRAIMTETQNELQKEISDFTQAELVAISKNLGLEENTKETKSKLRNNISIAITLFLCVAYIYAITNFVKSLSATSSIAMAFAVNFFVAFLLPILIFRFSVFILNYLEMRVEAIIDRYNHFKNYIFFSFFATCLAVIASCIYFTS